MLVMGDELDKTPGAGLKRLSCWSDNFEVDCRRCPGSNGVDLPRGSLTDTNFGFTNTGGFFGSGNSMTNHARHLQLFGRLNIEGGIESHLKVTLVIFVEHT